MLGALAIGVWLILNNLGGLITNLANHQSSFFVYVTYIIGLILGIYLTLGAYKEKQKWVEYYLWGKLIFLAIELIEIIGLFFQSPANAIWLFLTWCLEIYFWLCVNSYHLQLQGIVPATTTRQTTVVTRTVTTA
uniref:CSON011573 protein n=1 Tax=Culicoides sonorensis TaxID=179676 RepID=A0A336MFK8_CULSO